MNEQQDLQFDDDDEDDDAEAVPLTASVHATDWTTETIIGQLKRKNIALNPRFQRRDAWQLARKSKFIESLVVGLPIPQIVLAESKTSRGQFLVLDGKQRLLSLAQFWGITDSPHNGFPLSGLGLRRDLNRATRASLEASNSESFDALCNQTIRTVVIRNWSTDTFLHTVFLRLNTGSVALSPQELRQALHPGPFTDRIDDASARSEALKTLMGASEPDPRMRDVEILARYIAFHFFSKSYPGRMKTFLDSSFASLNKQWPSYASRVDKAIEDFDEGVLALTKIFGSQLARKPSSYSFNRAIFDALIWYHSDAKIRRATASHAAQLKQAYKALFAPSSKFLRAIESDTAGTPNTVTRMAMWGRAVSEVAQMEVPPPSIGVNAREVAKKKRSRKVLAKARK